MKRRSIDVIFIAIGILIGIILVLQIRTKPFNISSFPLDQIRIQKSLLETFLLEQEELKKSLFLIENRLEEERKILEQRSSRQTINRLNSLKKLTGFNTVRGEGIRITLRDNSAVTRLDFSPTDEQFVQASDLRDLINALFLKDARAISINGHRVLPLTPIQSAFDVLLVGNFQIVPPFVIETVGNPDALTEAVTDFRRRKIQIFIDRLADIEIGPREGMPSTKYLSLYEENTNHN